MNASKKRDPRTWIKVFRSGGYSERHPRAVFDHGVTRVDGLAAQNLSDCGLQFALMIGDATVPYTMFPEVP